MKRSELSSWIRSRTSLDYKEVKSLLTEIASRLETIERERLDDIETVIDRLCTCSDPERGHDDACPQARKLITEEE